ncbi:MAG: acetoacetate decarboxylase family protein [Actinobacteria bacterium]|nr:acetoacetate decarboxylase family protein [Actinomycetota bacterium]
MVELQEDFFADIEQVELKVDGGTARFPIFYRVARSFTVILPANVMKLRRMLPDPRFVPAQALPGVGAITLTAFEYNDTDIGPYNEFSMGIILNSPYYAPVPGYNLLRQYLDRMYNVYVYHLPVTTEIALRAGRDFYNYPKFIADIEFSDSAGRITCDLSRDGERIMSISGDKVPVQGIGEMKFMCNLYQYRQPQIAEFKLNVLDGTINWLPNNVSWAFNMSNPIGRELAGVVVGNRALMYLYMPKIEGILYGPANFSIPLLQHTILSKGFLPAAKKPAKKKPAKKKPAGKKKAAKKPKK